MENIELEKLRYPIGKFIKPEVITSKILAKAIETIASFPERLKAEVSHLSEAQLETPYRENGWTIRQVVHHCADSHMNCFIRIKWTLTEDNPTIKFYYESLWSDGIDNKTMPIEPSLDLLNGLHYRLAFVMKNLSSEELNKSYYHPQYEKTSSLKEVICSYAWHSNHHLAHITELKKRENWH